MVCAGILFKLLVVDPFVVNKSNDEVKNIYKAAEGKNKFDELLKINDEIVGWIFINGTRIDFPVLQSKDGTNYYLNHNYKKEESSFGSIFIGGNCKNGILSKNIIVHGHHMRRGEMFGDLMKFSDVDFCKHTPVIEFDSMSQQNSWKIISVFKTNTLPEQGELFDYGIPEFADSQSFLKYVKDVRVRSLINMPVDVNENDQLLTLSTCSYEFKGFHTVIVARKVRQDESRIVDTSEITKAANPLMPKCWYERYGGSAPQYS